MNRLLLVALICGHGFLVQAVGPQKNAYHIQPAYKKIKTEDFSLLFSGITVDEAKQIVEFGNEFLVDLQDKWSFVMSHSSIIIALTVDRSSRFEGGFNFNKRQGFLRIPRFDPEKIQGPLQEAFIQTLLNQGQANIPLFFQKGVSLFFSEYKAYDGLAMAYALLKHPQTTYFLRQANSEQEDETSFRVLSVMFIGRIWEQNRMSLIHVIQRLLQGQSFTESMDRFGWDNLDSSLVDFQIWAKTKYPISKFYLFPSFWKVFFVLCMFAMLLWHVYRSWHISALKPIHVSRHNSALSEGDISFSGPVFEQEERDDAISVHGHRFPPSEEEACVQSSQIVTGAGFRAARRPKARFFEVQASMEDIPVNIEVDRDMDDEIYFEIDNDSLLEAEQAIENDSDGFEGIPEGIVGNSKGTQAKPHKTNKAIVKADEQRDDFFDF